MVQLRLKSHRKETGGLNIYKYLMTGVYYSKVPVSEAILLKDYIIAIHCVNRILLCHILLQKGCPDDGISFFAASALN